MFCPNCGTKNEADARFCASCGTPLAVEDVTENIEYTFNAEESQPDMSQEQRDPYAQPEMTNDPYAQPEMQSDPYMQQQTTTKQKKSAKKSTIFLILQGILTVALFIALILVIRHQTSPEKVVEDYWKAYSSGNYSAAYDECIFPVGNELSKQMYVDVQTDANKQIKYLDSKITHENEDDPENDYYVITYKTDDGNEGEKTLSLTQIEETQYGFFHQWKILGGSDLVKDVQMEIPSEATVSLNGMELSAEDVVDNGTTKTMTFPYLFAGTYQLEVAQEGMETYRMEYDPTKNYVQVPSLVPGEDTIATVAQQATKDLQTLFDSALAGKDYDTVSSLFTDGKKSLYEEMVKLRGDGKTYGIVELQLSNLEFRSLGIDLTGGLELECTCDYTSKYLRTLGNTTLQDSSGEEFFYIQYVMEDGKWLIENLSISEYLFS